MTQESRKSINVLSQSIFFHVYKFFRSVVPSLHDIPSGVVTRPCDMDSDVILVYTNLFYLDCDTRS